MGDNGSCEGKSDENGSGNTNSDARQRPELSLDATLEMLAHRERRYILSYLMNASDDIATIDEIVDHIVQSETERLNEVPNRAHYEVALHHIHLPKLTEAGVLEYDSRSQQLRYWGDDLIEKWLDRIQREE